MDVAESVQSRSAAPDSFEQVLAASIDGSLRSVEDSRGRAVSNNDVNIAVVWYRIHLADREHQARQD